MTNLKSLQELGAFVDEVPVKKEIKFKVNGSEVKADIHVRKISTGDSDALFVVAEEGRSKTAEIIHKCILLGENAEESMTYAQAYQLHHEVGAAMVKAFNEVNFAKKT